MYLVTILKDGPDYMRCLTCESPTGDDATLCKHCVTDLRRDLQELGPALTDLRVTAARLDKGAASVGRASGSNPLPVNFDATDIERDVERTLIGWVKDIKASAATDALPAPARSLHRLPQWIAAQLGTVRMMDTADQLMSDIRTALSKCRRAVDRAEQKVFAGTCPTESGGVECGAILMATQGSTVAHCKVCGQDFDVATWRSVALAWSLDQSAYPETISRALSDPVTGECVPAEAIRRWAHRGLIRAVNEDHAAVADHPVRRMYLIRDVHDVWVEHLRGSYIKTSRIQAGQESILTA